MTYLFNNIQAYKPPVYDILQQSIGLSIPWKK